MEPFLLVTKSSPPSGGAQKKRFPSGGLRKNAKRARAEAKFPRPYYPELSVMSPELMAVNPESIPSRAQVETITHSLLA